MGLPPHRLAAGAASHGALAAFVAVHLAASASAATIYSNLKDIAIPLDLTGVYLDVDGGTMNTQEFTGWDINPFFGGVGVAGSPAFQPARIGMGNLDTILRLAVGATVDVSRIFSTGYGGSQTHLGPQFTRSGRLPRLHVQRARRSRSALRLPTPAAILTVC